MQNSTSSWGGTADTAALPDERNIKGVMLEVEARGNLLQMVLLIIIYIIYKVITM